MAKRWTMNDDLFIHAYFETVGDFIGPHDLDRPKGAVTRRAKHLKDTGAWAALDAMKAAEKQYFKALGIETLDDILNESEARFLAANAA